MRTGNHCKADNQERLHAEVLEREQRGASDAAVGAAGEQELTVAEGETRSWAVERSTLSLPGEPGAGRLQVRFEWLLPRGLPRGTVLLPTMELINTATGATQAQADTVLICRPHGCYQIIVEIKIPPA
ncbi:MAG: hypothetical protein L0Z53_23900 [Acidobacteriales bacterium]|nr:hypothetical protein [Terriglobales bacterium]